MTKTNQMITIHLFTGPADTEGVAVQATVGQTLMAAAVDANVDGIAADCGGTLTCATCHVMVREPWLSRLEACRPMKTACWTTRRVRGRLTAACHVRSN